MRAKLRITSITLFPHNTEKLTFSAVGAEFYGMEGDDENNTYAKFTPSAELEMVITNPKLVGSFKPNDVFIVSFAKVTPKAKE